MTPQYFHFNFAGTNKDEIMKTALFIITIGVALVLAGFYMFKKGYLAMMGSFIMQALGISPENGKRPLAPFNDYD